MSMNAFRSTLSRGRVFYSSVSRAAKLSAPCLPHVARCCLSSVCDPVISPNAVKPIDALPINPNLSPTDPPRLLPFTCISFYRFVPLTEAEVDQLVTQGPLALSSNPNIKGTLLVATEGINGQFCVPTNELSAFHDALVAISSRVFSDLHFNMGQELLTYVKDEAFPFKKLKFKAKKEVLTDKINELDWNDAGPELSPQAWHEELKNINNLDGKNSTELPPLLFDCRNDYESDMGTFANAIPLNTSSFSETWTALSEMLKNEPPQRRILTFCTGGIRCVKVNAFLKQKLGFENIGRLENGIIAYDKWLEVNNSTENTERQSMFVGKNFLFDRRRLKDEKQQL